MKLTKQQRHVVYVIMHYELSNAKTEQYAGLCSLIFDVFNAWQRFSLSNRRLRLKDLKELWDKRPEGLSERDLWFRMFARRPRLILLEKCIEETADC